MKITSYFIKKPVASIVLNCMLIMIGIICMNSLSIREYPKAETSVITVVSTYPNASPDLVETSLTNILEDKLSGVEGVETIRSWSSHGKSEIRLNFKMGTQIDKAVSDIRDGISLARSNLPIDVKEPVIIKSGKSMGDTSFMYICIESKSMSFGELTHYAKLNIKNSLRSISGVSAVEVMGPEYMYSICLDPKKLYAFGINVLDVFNTIHMNNMSLPVGKYDDIIPSTLESELKNDDDFKNLIIRYQNLMNPREKQYAVFLKDIANIKLTTSDDMRIHVNKNPGIFMSIDLSSDANPLEVSKSIKKELSKIKRGIPEDMKIDIVMDQSDFIDTSINNIYHATFEAVILVLCIVFLFLRNIISTIVPLITIPISLIGSILFLKICGFSINTMTLLAMVLAVGLVVDDAIVILENIARHIEEGKSSRQAAIEGSNEIGFAIIAITLTLVSVFAPFAFIQGSIGQLFIEFAVALAGSVLLSGIVALTLSPLMCSVILKKNSKTILPQFDIFFERLITKYKILLSRVIINKKIPYTIAIISSIVSIFFFIRLPSETAPKEDRGLIGLSLPSIPSQNLDFYDNQLRKVENMIDNIPEIKHILGITSDWGTAVILPLKLKKNREKSANEIINSIYPRFLGIPSQDVWPWSWDSNLPGLSDEISFSDIEIVISSTEDYKNIYKVIENIRSILDKNPSFKNVRHDLDINTLTYKIEINHDIASKLGINNQQISRAIEVFFSGNRSLNFQKDGILYDIKIEVQKSPMSLSEIYIINNLGKKISLSTIANIRKTTEPKKLFHHNQMKSVTLGVNIGDKEKFSTAYEKLNRILDENLPKSYKKSPIGAAKSLEESSNTMTLLFILSIIFIFAILSVQFNNFLDPIIVLMTIPLACSGALFTLWIFDISLNIYTQVGLITLIGLITKHGILIVEFVNQLIKNGMNLKNSIREASSLRLRPILMTTGAMIFGLIPLVLSKDSGHESRECLGYVLIGGLFFGTFFTLVVLPTICYNFKKSFQKNLS